MKRSVLISTIMLFTIIAAGCNFNSPSEKMYEKLEEVVKIESGFEEQQEPLVKLEKKEQDIYSKIISLGLEDMNEITKLSDEALESISKRKEYMDKEAESIKQSQKKFETIATDIEELDKKEENSLKNKADDLYQTMMARYEEHDKLYANYIEGLNSDKKLYEMFKDEDVNMDDLEKQVKKINDTYETVYKNNQTFNELTKKYNDLKVDFYKEAGIKIKMNEEEEEKK